MSEYVFTPPAVVALPVVGSDAKFPVRRVYCVGRNYVEHAKEMGFTGREEPFFFSKPADALLVIPNGTQGKMQYPSKTSNLHYEMELVVALGSGGRDIPVEKANACIFGYALGLDMTRRDLQGECKKQGRPWEVGKAFDQGGPIGPVHPVTKTGLLSSGAISLEVNGQVKQSSNLDKLIWSIPESISYLSGLFELKAGDLIFSGTPEGVGAVVKGDRMLGRFEGLGELDVVMV
jgi:fumarylpyruvate hydrolase